MLVSGMMMEEVTQGRSSSRLHSVGLNNLSRFVGILITKPKFEVTSIWLEFWMIELKISPGVF